MKLLCAVTLVMAATRATADETRTKQLLDSSWRFNLGSSAPVKCTDSQFPTDLTNKQCMGLTQAAQYADEEGCRDGCCGSNDCEVWQWCPAGSNDCSPSASCWLGKLGKCVSGKGWVSRARTAPPPPPPAPPGRCNQPYCEPGFDDGSWRVLDLPHDFVVEGNFSASASDKSHGFLPYNVGWYRRNFTLTSADAAKSVWIEFEGVQRNSQVWLNGKLLGTHLSGYTSFNYDITQLVRPAPGANSLVVFVDATQPDGWWYDGGLRTVRAITSLSLC